MGGGSGYYKNGGCFWPVPVFFLYFDFKLVSHMQNRDESLKVNTFELILNNL